MSVDREDTTQALHKALRHPLRRAMLRLFIEEGGSLSPKELALVTNEPVTNVAYHARTLQELGALVLVRERSVRGAVEHFYMATALVKDTPWVLASLDLDPLEPAREAKG